MTKHRQQRIKDIFREALGLEVTEWPRFLATRCNGDAELQAEVESLLQYHDNQAGILDAPPDFSGLGLAAPPRGATTDPDEALVGTTIGNFRLLEFLGRGGMGLVYLAEQQQPVQRRVALKIVRSGAEAAEILARFESERQALALMDHPSIARIIDAATTTDGRPYFTMEYVTGVPITEYCELHRLSITARLRLFLGICDGVQHAHQKGILHRDLKPSNILVTVRTEGPVAKIIDFGVAKALHRPFSDATPVTAHGRLVGTPDYMSPEQAASGGQDIDTRADIYSLGVLLYELLCGCRPLDLKQYPDDGYNQMLARIVEHEPLPPSARVKSANDLETIAHRRRVSPRDLFRFLRHDLDWIILKALEKDRTRRYDTAADLGADLKRYLAGEAVLAGPPSLRYRLGKFVHKHKVSMVAALVVLLALCGGLAASLNFAFRAESARQAAHTSSQLAERNTAKAEAITRYMQSVLETASPRRGGDPHRTIPEALALTDHDLDKVLADAPELKTVVHLEIAEIFRELGFTAEAEPHARQAVDELRRLPDSDPDDLAHSLALYGLTLGDLSRPHDAGPVMLEALELYRASSDADSYDNEIWVWRNQISIASVIMDYQETVAAYRELIAYQRQHENESSLALARTQWLFGHFLSGNALFEEGEQQLTRTLEIFREHYGERHDSTARARFSLGSLYRKQGAWETAAPLLQVAFENLFSIFGPEHRTVLMVERALAEALSGLGQFARADSLLAANVAKERQRGGNDAEAVGQALIYQAEHFRRHDRLEQALACYREAYRIAEAASPRSDFALWETALQNLARFDGENGSWPTARYRLETCLDSRRERLRPDHPKTISVLEDLSRVLLRLEDYPAAAPVAEAFFESALREYGPRHTQTGAAAGLNLELGELRQDPVGVSHWSDWLQTNGFLSGEQGIVTSSQPEKERQQ
ncbi:MAG: serine/threonine-protein kinase [bacterium]